MRRKGPAVNDTTNSTSNSKKSDGFTDEERAAMKERAKELRAEASRDARDAKAREKGEADLLEKIAEMPESDRVIAERLHALITENAPELLPKTWYGMPAYAKDGEVVCFFQAADKFKSRYSTFGFNDPANLDDGSMWATSFALTKLTADDETKIATLVKKAVS
jgi:uncharacterized protein YdhG (YjbR/CyaY superfamily)